MSLCPPCREFLRRHPLLRKLLWLAVISAVFSWIGANAPQVVMPVACKIYG